LAFFLRDSLSSSVMRRKIFPSNDGSSMFLVSAIFIVPSPEIFFLINSRFASERFEPSAARMST